MTLVTQSEVEDHARRLRGDLVDHLTQAGALRSPGWQAAFAGVPRHRFIPYAFRQAAGGGWEALDGTRPERRGEWLALVHADDAVVTQLDGDPARWETAVSEGAVVGVPSSSSSQPALMASMLEALDVADGHSVLEVGTGTGYNAALLCERLGADRVTTIDVDPVLVADARGRLAACGYHPTVAVRDGAAGCAARAPYDRVIVTYGAARIEPAWIAQTRPGAVLVVNLHSYLAAMALVKLVARRDGSAEGRVLADRGAFMPSRTTAGLDLQAHLRKRPEVSLADSRPTRTDPQVLGDPGSMVLPGLLLRDIGWIRRKPEGGRWETWLFGADGAWARVTEDPDGQSWQVVQGGARRIWDQLEAVLSAWMRLGRPRRNRFGLTVTPDGRHRLWCDRPDAGNVWDLPM